MTKTLTAAAMLLFFLIVASCAFAVDVQESTDRFGTFGTLHIYKTSTQPKHLTLFVSGDGGWNLGVIDMARSLTELDSMVVGPAARRT